MLKQTFMSLVGNYSDNIQLSEKLWLEIEKHYSQKSRHYHTLGHLENLYIQLEKVKDQIVNQDVLLFSLYYHDVIYKTTSKNNERKSAELATDRLKDINYPPDKIAQVNETILATASHSISTNNDINLFTDADLAILGQDGTTYQNYCHQIRREFSIYPDFVYKPGRKKVLQHFLNMERIYKTDYFFHLYESAALENIQKELETL